MSTGQKAQVTIPVTRLSAPDLSTIRSQDLEREKQAMPHRIAVALHAGISFGENGVWQDFKDGSRIWRIQLESTGALAMSVNFADFQLPEGTSLFIYDPAMTRILGAFDQRNYARNGFFATELIPGDNLVVEVDINPGAKELPGFTITEVSYVYRDIPEFINRGTSDPCEVNINCPEGDNWQKQKRGVVRILVKESGGFFWCTGSLVNNTRQDLVPFLLTADHCGADASDNDINQWVFYFNYEDPGCDNSTTTPDSYTMTGAARLANASTNGSDFLLLLLNEDIPQGYQPYFNGWNNENLASPSGISIHHPAGDVKKISTYAEPLISTQWGSTPNTHWQVTWTETANGWGVTEGGSSGAPLFDNNGRIVGTLTGGLAACEPGGGGIGTGPDKPDYFGKFSFSWDQNGTTQSEQLKPWLDPDNTGLTSLPGINADLTASFQADETLILGGSYITFTNLSSGLPIFWHWFFEGGTPSTYEGQNPPDIKYNTNGQFDVSLTISDGILEDTLLLKDYIQVVGKIYPNPADSYVNIYLESALPAALKAEVFNMLGQKISETEFPEQSNRLVKVDLSGVANGMYVVRLEVKQRYIFSKVFVNHPAEP